MRTGLTPTANSHRHGAFEDTVEGNGYLISLQLIVDKMDMPFLLSFVDLYKGLGKRWQTIAVLCIEAGGYEDRQQKI